MPSNLAPPQPWDRSGLGVESRFWIQRELGRGVGSLVVDVWDALHDVRRALKIATSSASRRAFEAEYRLLTELRHPHVVRAYDFGVSRTGLPYYTLELIDGVGFDAFAWGEDPEVIAPVALQILEALAMLHLRGVVHRDLKPRNVLVAGEGVAKVARLIDFGLAMRVGEAGSTGGTLPYMAPEAARGEPVDGRADLYALGVMLYEALVPDAAADDLRQVAQRHIEAPPSPQELNPLIPPAFADFVMQLMEPDPDKRFASSLEAASALTSCDMRLGQTGAMLTAERLMRGGALAHRPAEIERLVNLTNDLHSCVVAGADGVGKTPLLRELGVRLCLGGFRVAHFRTSLASDAPVDRLLRAAHALRPDVVAEITPEWLQSKDAEAQAKRLSSLLVDAFADTPTALILDDVQLAEPFAMSVVRLMAEDERRRDLVIICATNDLTVAPLGEDTPIIHVQPLDAAAAAALVAHRINGLSLPPPALERLVSDGHGEPALIERTLARFFVDRLIVRRGSKYVFAGGRYRAQADDWQERLQRLDPALATSAQAAAVLGEGIDATRVAALTGDDVAMADKTLAELARSGFLAPAHATSRPGYIFARRAIAQQFYAQISETQRRELHDRAAALFATPAGEEPSVALIGHVLNGSDGDQAIALATKAGDRAARVFADKHAIDYYAHAYERLADKRDVHAATIALRLGRSFQRIGELERCMQCYRVALAEGVRSRDVTVEASLGLAAALLAGGSPREAGRHAAAALSLIDDSTPHLKASALRIQASVAIDAGEHAVAAERLARANEILEHSLSPLFAFRAPPEVSRLALALSVEVLLELARLARRNGELTKAVRHAKRALQRARAIGDPSAIAEASSVLARGFARAGRLPSARRALFSGLRGVRGSGDKLREATVLRELGHVRLREGNFEAALDRYANSLAIMRSLKAHAHESACLSNIGFVRTMLGEFRAADRALALAVDIAQASGDLRAQVMAAIEQAHAWAWLGDLVAAQATLRAVIDTPRVASDLVAYAIASSLEGWVDARLGCHDAAGAFLARVDAHIAPLEDPADEAFVLFYAGYTALVLARPSEARRLLTALSDIVDGGALAYFVAPTALLAADVARAEGDTVTTKAALERALVATIEQRIRPLEVLARMGLGILNAGTDAGAEQLTSAMECLQGMVHDMPEAMAQVLLSSQPARRLHSAFVSERARVLGLV